MGNKAVGSARRGPQQNENNSCFGQPPNGDADFPQSDRHTVQQVDGRLPQFEYPQSNHRQADPVNQTGPKTAPYVKRCQPDDYHGNDQVQGHVQKVDRHVELFEKNLTEPDQQHPEKIPGDNCKMGRTHCKAHVGLDLVDVFFKKMADFLREKPGNQIGETNGPELHKSNRMKKILTEFLKQGKNVLRNVF